MLILQTSEIPRQQHHCIVLYGNGITNIHPYSGAYLSENLHTNILEFFQVFEKKSQIYREFLRKRRPSQKVRPAGSITPMMYTICWSKSMNFKIFNFGVVPFQWCCPNICDSWVAKRVAKCAPWCDRNCSMFRFVAINHNLDVYSLRQERTTATPSWIYQRNYILLQLLDWAYSSKILLEFKFCQWWIC